MQLDAPGDLAASDRRVRALLENVRLLGVILDPAGRILLANRHLLDLTGRTAEEAIGADWFSMFLAADHVEDVRSIFLANIARGHVRDHSSNVVRTRDGRRRTIEWNNTLLLAPDGSVDSVAAIGVDTTDRHEAERALRESWSSTRAALDATVESVAIFRPILDAEGRFVDAETQFLNDAARARWVGGLAMDEVRGRPVFELLPYLRPLIFELYAAVVESGTPFRGIRDFPMSDGVHAFDLAITPYEGGFVHVGRDVTLERQAVDALRTSEERLRRTFEGVDAIVGYQEDGEGTLVLSPAVERILGYAPGELTSLAQWNALVHPDDIERCRLVWEREPDTWELEYRMRRPDGRWIWIGDRGRRITGPTGAPGMFGVMVDITGQRDLEAQLRQAQRLEAVGQLAGGIAHDFNNVLAAIRGYVELARDSLAGTGTPADARAARDLDEALRAADRAASLTRQLLVFSRLQAPAGDALADAGAVVTGLSTMLDRLLGEHFELVTDVEDGARWVRIDPSQLEQIVLNLAINARDAMPDGGVLRITVTGVGLDSLALPDGQVLPGGPGVRISVLDSGCGMDEATLARIFDPFFTTKEMGKGTGLGLATVHAIVRGAQGRVSVSSTPGSGTLFRVDLPLAVGAETTAPADPARHDATIPPEALLLLVEDDDAVRAVLTRVLRGAGYEVLAAASGPEALELMEAWGRRIDLLVSDVRMPRMQGTELARRAREALPDLPILFISAFSAELDPAVLALPDVQLLDKPFDMETLRAAVRAALDGDRPDHG